VDVPVEGGGQPTVLLEMSAIVEGRADDRIVEVFELTVGSITQLRGIPLDSRVAFATRGGSFVTQLQSRGWSVRDTDMSAAATVMPHLGEPLAIDILAELRRTVELNVRVPADVAAPKSLSLAVVDEAGNVALRTTAKLRSRGGAATLELRVPDGEWTVIATTCGLHDVGVGLFGSSQLKVAEVSLHGELILNVGQALEGTAVDGVGNRLPHSVLQWKLVTQSGDAAEGALIAVESDAEGRFALTGLPFSGRLVGLHGTSDVELDGIEGREVPVVVR